MYQYLSPTDLRTLAAILIPTLFLLNKLRRPHTNPGGLKLGVSEVMLNRVPGRIFHFHWETALRVQKEGRSSWEVHVPLTSTMHLTISPENVRHVLIDKFSNYPKGKFWRSTFQDLLGDGIFNADGFR